MDESLANLLMVIYAVASPSASGLLAYWMTLRERRRRAAAHEADLDELRRSIEELQERLDFAERALGHGRTNMAIKPKHTTPV
jgi:hypothetical protein